jgi:hypothetical protein
MRRFIPSNVAPTGELAKVLLDLAIGDGMPLEGEGIGDGGRTIRNTAIRRMGGVS